MLRLQDGAQKFEYKRNVYEITLDITKLRKEVVSSKEYGKILDSCLAVNDYNRFKVNSPDFNRIYNQYLICVSQNADKLLLTLANKQLIDAIESGFYKPLLGEVVDPRPDPRPRPSDEDDNDSVDDVGPTDVDDDDPRSGGRVIVTGYYCLNGIVSEVLVSIRRNKLGRRRYGRFDDIQNGQVVLWSSFQLAYESCSSPSTSDDSDDTVVQADEESTDTVSAAETSQQQVQSFNFESRSVSDDESVAEIIYQFKSCWSGNIITIGLNGPGLPTSGAPGYNTINFIESGESNLQSYVDSNAAFFQLLADNYGADGIPILPNSTVIRLNGTNIAGNNNSAGQCFYFHSTADGTNAANVNTFITTLPEDIEIVGKFPEEASGTGCNACVNPNRIAPDPCDDVNFSLSHPYSSNFDTDYNITVTNANQPGGPTGSFNFDFYAYDTSIDTNIATTIGNGILLQSGSSGILLDIGNYATPFNETTGIDGWNNTQYAFYAVITDANGCFTQYEFFAGVDPNNQPVDIYGCMDPSATNFNPNANIEDGSCQYDIEGCTDPDAFNYNPNASVDNGSCIPKRYGCTDPTSNNYDSFANTDDGSCQYETTGGTGTIDPIELSDDEIKRIDTECKFSTDVYQTMASMRYGMTNICHNTIDKKTIKKELCAWDDKEEKVYDSVTYNTIHYTGGPQGAPEWVNLDCLKNAKGSCNPKFNPETNIESVNYECVTVQVVTQNGTPVQGYEVINNAGNIGYTDENGLLNFTIFLDGYSKPSDYIQTFGLEHCWQVVGNCRSTLIQVTVNDPCEIQCEPPIIDECEIPVVSGCTNPEAANYDPTATVDDGSCILCIAYEPTISFVPDTGSADAPNGKIYVNVLGVDVSSNETIANGTITLTEGQPGHYNIELIVLEGGSVPTIEGLGTTEILYSNLAAGDYQLRITTNSNRYNGCVTTRDITIDDGIDVGGCMDPESFNYNPSATYDDGSCCYIKGCTNPAADNYDATACQDDGSCIISGCTDPQADNYNPAATVDDGSCSFCDNFDIVILGITAASTCSSSDGTVQATGTGGSANYSINVYNLANVPQNPFGLAPGTYVVEVTDVNNGCVATQEVTITCDATVSGCTDPGADNYNPAATQDDGSCTYCSQFDIQIIFQSNPTYSGATDGVIQATGVNGSSSYNLVVTDSFGIVANPFALGQGTYTATVTDTNYNCTATTIVTLTDEDAPNPCDNLGYSITSNVSTDQLTYGVTASGPNGEATIRYKWEINPVIWCGETSVEYTYEGQIYNGIYEIRFGQFYDYIPWYAGVNTIEMHKISVVSITNLTTPGQFYDSSQIGGAPQDVQETVISGTLPVYGFVSGQTYEVVLQNNGAAAGSESGDSQLTITFTTP